ncbi:MAG: hypothetical protein GY906_20475 [bacterium]|nr:hypothetical protein [bacterium]
MDYYLVTTYHGPIIYIDNDTTWSVAAPGRQTETYDGSLPQRCLVNARPIPASEARHILSPSEMPQTTSGPICGSVIDSLTFSSLT